MRSQRDEILAKINQAATRSHPLPERNFTPLTYAKKPERFAAQLESVGGVLVDAKGDAIEKVIRRHYPDAEKIASDIPNCKLTTVDATKISDPHELQNLDLAILSGRFGVAENGAVLLQKNGKHPRALYFIAAHVVIILPRDEIVHNMHEAVARTQLKEGDFTVFVSGPSKTADIEQALVTGAHGPKSLCVVLV